jgi:peroxiredoxin Q/BCP
MTGGCTAQACSYRDDHAKLEEAGTIVVGISGDEVSNLKHFKEANNLNFTLLSDKDGSVARQFGVPLGEGGSIEQEIDGQTLQLDRGVTASRWTFIADKDGEIRYINRSVDAANDSKNVLEVIAELNLK